MLIILEGCDLAGKTTFINTYLLPEIERQTTTTHLLEVLKKGPATLQAMDEYEDPLLDYRPGRNKNVICDRWHWGEAVYPDVVGRSSLMDDVDFWHIEHLLMSRGAVVVHMSPPVEQIMSRYDIRGDNYISRDQLPSIKRRFINVATRQSWLPQVTIQSTTAAELRHDAMVVVAAALAHEVDAIRLNQFTTYVGSRAPRVLLLGDVRGGDYKKHGLRPAFQTHSTSSGRWLINALNSNLDYTSSGHVGLANACDVDDAEKLWQMLDRPVAIALGSNAFKQCADFVSGRVIHPQHMRRFRHDEDAWYVKQIADIVDWKVS